MSTKETRCPETITFDFDSLECDGQLGHSEDHHTIIQCSTDDGTVDAKITWPVKEHDLDYYLNMVPHSSIEDGLFTRDQVMSYAPLKNGNYRLYRWECDECQSQGTKQRFIQSIEHGKAHSDRTGHTAIEIRGGGFPLSELGKK